MFALLRSNIYAAVVVGILVAASLLYGYQWGASNERLACADARAEAERQVAVALAELAHQRATADAEAEKRRAEAGRLSREIRELRDEQLAALPAADCRVDDDRRMLIHGAYCARFATAPACVSGSLPGVPDPAPAD